VRNMNRSNALMSLGAFCLLFAACSDDGASGSHRHPAARGATSAEEGSGAVAASTDGGDRNNGDAGPHGSSVASDGTHLSASIIARQVQPGDEQHVCVIVELPNTDATWVDEIHATLGSGSHHMLVDRQAPGTPTQLDPSPCPPTLASDQTRLILAQQADTVVALPSGVAFLLAPHQPLYMQLHYANVGTQVRDIVGTVELTRAPPTATAPVQANSILTGSFSIDLPPDTTTSVDSFYTVEPATATRHVFALTSHMHHLGIRATIERVPSADAPPASPIHVSTSWDDPPLTQFSPPLDFTGNDGLRLTCTYDNTTAQTVNFGTATTDEMCFMWVYYFDQ